MRILTDRKQSVIIFFIGVDCIIITVTAHWISVDLRQIIVIVVVGVSSVSGDAGAGVYPGVVAVDRSLVTLA